MSYILVFIKFFRQLFMKTRIYDMKCNRDNCCICVNKNRLCQVKGCVY